MNRMPSKIRPALRDAHYWRLHTLKKYAIFRYISNNFVFIIYVSISTRVYVFMFAACLFISIIFFCAVATAANKGVSYIINRTTLLT